MPIWILGLLSGTRKLLLKAWEFFTDDPWRLFVIVAAVFAFLWWRADARADKFERQRNEARQLAADTRKAFDKTVADYRAAAVEAERIQQANLARVKAERAAIDERTIHDLKTARDSADARYRRLLASAAEADTSRAADPDLSAVTDAACESYAGTDCAGLPAKLKAAQDNTDQLIALQAWVAGQAVVVTSPVTGSR